MKTTKKILVFSFFCMTLTSLFLIPIAPAQEVVYDGANTEQFPYFSMYPSERYEFNVTMIYEGNPIYEDEQYVRHDLIKGNESGHYSVASIEKGYCIWGNWSVVNATSGFVQTTHTSVQFSFWNDTIPFNGYRDYIPVESDGKVSASIFNAITGDNYTFGGHYQNWRIYPGIYSIHLWNGTGIDIYEKVNYTDDGILKYSEAHNSGLYHLDIALMSQPAQLPPVFSFTTETGDLLVTSKHIHLNLTILSADNNNDGLSDTDYEYRILEGGVWSNWALTTPIIDYDFGSVSAGNYTITVEVKNMYGVSQEHIEIEYIPSSADADTISGSSAMLIMIIVTFSVSVLLIIYRKKYLDEIDTIS